MTYLFSVITAAFIPAMAAVIIAYGLSQKAPVYDYFIEGARKGLETALDILPFLIGIFLAINCLSASGLLNLVNRVLHPFFRLLGVPPELLPLICLRAISGSGSRTLKNGFSLPVCLQPHPEGFIRHAGAAPA